MTKKDVKQKNVCMIAYSPYIADARIKREAETLVKYGWKVSVIMLSHDRQKTLTQLNGVTCIPLNVGKYMGKGFVSYLLSYVLFGIKAMFKCTLLTLQGQVDSVHVHNMPNFLVFCAIVPKLLGKKIVLDIHDSMIETYQGKFGTLKPCLYAFLYMEEKISALFANRIVCVNHIQMKPLMERGIPEKKITILLNVPDHSIFNASVAAKPELDKQHINLVYHGTLDMALGIDIALKAVALLKVEVPNIHLHIIGGGKDQEYFRKLIDDLGITSHVTYNTVGVSVSEVPGMLQKMHIGIIPNRKNAATRYMLPVKMLEYVSLNIPVVVPRLETIQYYFDENAVCYYESENVEDMVRAIRLLVLDEKLRRQKIAGAAKMLERYGWPTHQYDLVNMYKKLSGEKVEP